MSARRMLSVMAVLGGLLFAVPAFAQSGSGSLMGSGSTMPEPQTLRERANAVASLQGEAQPTRSLLTAALKAVEALQAERRNDRLRMRQHLQECHDELRRANRDQKFPTTLRCFRGRLMLELTWLRRERIFLQEDKSVRVEARDATLAMTDALIDALATIVTGIDSGVYSDEAGMREAKTLLHGQYRLRQWASVLHTNADRMLSWVASLARDAAPYLPETEGMPSAWDAPVECLEDAASWLIQARGATSYDDTLAAWTSARTQTSTCLLSIKKAMKSRGVTGTGGTLE